MLSLDILATVFGNSADLCHWWVCAELTAGFPYFVITVGLTVTDKFMIHCIIILPFFASV